MKTPMINRLLPTALLPGILLLTAASPSVAQPAPAPAAQEAPKNVRKNLAPVAKDVLQVQLPKAQEFTLRTGGAKTGARVLAIEDHRLPLITIRISLPAGSLQDNVNRPGIASFTADLLTEGTTSRSYEQITQEIERMGATLSASAGSERMELTVSGKVEDTDKLIDLLADSLMNPSFPADRLKQLQFQTVAQLTQQQNNPGFLAGELSRRVFYGASTPYGRPSANRTQIEAVTPADLKAFHAAHYINSPEAIIGIVGDVRARDIYNKLNRALGKWKSGKAASLPESRFAAQDKTSIYLVDRPNSTQTSLLFGNLGIRRDDPDYFPLLLANRVLGGGSNGRLFLKLREEKGYTYGAYSSLSTAHYPGLWSASASVRNAVTAPAVGDFLQEFSRIQTEPVPAEELNDAKRSIIGSFAMSLESPGSILSRLMDVVDYGLPADYWQEYPKKVEAITSQDIQRVAKKYLGTGRIQLFVVGERKDIEEGLKPYGPITVLTPQQVLNPDTPGGAAAP